MTQGGCLCGAVRFEVRAFSSGVFKCHCSKCRKAFGGASSAAVLAAQDDFSWTRGESAIGEYRASPGFLRRFCPACGSILPQHLADFNSYWIPAGLLEGDPGLALWQHIHVDSRASWEVLDAHTPARPAGFDS
ncbi:MAG: aldehyde-activating protein [Halioglobus sp.]|nr:aldehyde-activating protein [Halioglobus sp.]